MENVGDLCGGNSNTPAQNTLRVAHDGDDQRSLSCLVDWVGFTLLDKNPDTTRDLNYIFDFFEYLGIERDSWKQGRKNYEGYGSSVNFENINIYFDGEEDQGIHVDLTGQACRYLETLFIRRCKLSSKSEIHIDELWLQFFDAVSDLGKVKFSRIDIAIDDIGSNHFNVPDLFMKLLRGEVRMKFKSWSPDGYFGSDGKAKSGMTLYFGSDTSRFQVCIYEKGKQLELDSVNWTRTELRFKHERAEDLVRLLRDGTNIVSIGVTAAQILAHYITFVEQGKDTNKARWPVSPFWKKYLDGVKPLRLTSKLPDRSIQRTANWFSKQVTKGFAMMHLAFYGIHRDWDTKMMMDGLKKLNKHDLEIVQEYRRLFEESEGNYTEFMLPDYINIKKDAGEGAQIG